MATSANTYPENVNSGKPGWFGNVLRRAPLIMMTVIFTMISVRNLVQPAHSAAAAGIAFTSPRGVAIARIGLGALPLALAILAFASLVFARWRLAGLFMVLTVDGVVILVRTLGMWLDHSSATAGLLAPEFVLLALAINAIRLESSVLRAGIANN
jgi:hypothetical protein